MSSHLLYVFFAFLFIDWAPVCVRARNTVSYYNEFDCESESVLKKIISKSESMSIGVECNSFVKGEMAYNLTAVLSNGTDIILEVNRNQIQMLTVNGNNVQTMVGEVTGGDCAGDHLLAIIVLTADEQKGCKSEDGLMSATQVYSYAVVDGKCRSRCGNGSGYFKLARGIKGIPEGRNV